MLTPQEVSEHAFAKASFGGYNMAMVDEFLDLLTADYSTLYNENAVLKSKMKVLVDKVEEYRSTEEAMRKALMTAQRMADEMVREAEQQKQKMLQEAQQEVADKVAELNKQVAEEEFRLAAAQRATAEYVAKVQTLHKDAQEYLEHLDEITPVPKPVSIVDEAAQEIEDSVQRLLAAAQADVQAELAREEQAEKEDTTEFALDLQPANIEPEQAVDLFGEPEDDLQKTAVHHIDFGDLQFGKDYEIK